MNRPNIGVFRWSFRRFPHFVGKVVREGRRKACACGHYVARFVRSALGGRTGSSPAAHATFSPRKFCGVEGGKEGREEGKGTKGMAGKERGKGKRNGSDGRGGTGQGGQPIFAEAMMMEAIYGAGSQHARPPSFPLRPWLGAY